MSTNFQQRLRQLEFRVIGVGREAEFHALCDGEYDYGASLRKNLRRAQIPPGAIPFAQDVAALPQGADDHGADVRLEA